MEGKPISSLSLSSFLFFHHLPGFSSLLTYSRSDPKIRWTRRWWKRKSFVIAGKSSLFISLFGFFSCLFLLWSLCLLLPRRPQMKTEEEKEKEERETSSESLVGRIIIGTTVWRLHRIHFSFIFDVNVVSTANLCKRERDDKIMMAFPRLLSVFLLAIEERLLHLYLDSSIVC